VFVASSDIFAFPNEDSVMWGHTPVDSEKGFTPIDSVTDIFSVNEIMAEFIPKVKWLSALRHCGKLTIP
jgi:hypothetical protein